MENQQTTTIEKSIHSGWQAKTRFFLEDVTEGETKGKRCLTVTTYKGRFGAQSIATVSIINTERGFHTETMSLFEDYRQTVKDHPTIKRITEKAIEEAHKIALQEVAPHIEAAKKQYNIAA